MSLWNASVSQLTDRQLIDGLRELARKDAALTADLLAHLGEVDARRLCDQEAEGSLWGYCVKVLNFSEGATSKRITAARTARKYPVILEMVARGDLHVSAINELASHLTEENHRELLRQAARLTRSELKELLAKWFPKPDAPTVLRKLPDRARARTGAGADDGTSMMRPLFGWTASGAAPAAAGTGFARRGACSEPAPGAGAAGAPCGGLGSTAELKPPAAALEMPPHAAVSASSHRADRGSVAPLSPGRYKLQVTFSGETRDKLLRAQELMRHVQPNGDLAVVLDRALTCLVQELEGRKFGRRKHAKAKVVGTRGESDPESSPEGVRPGAAEVADGSGAADGPGAPSARDLSARPIGGSSVGLAPERTPSTGPSATRAATSPRANSVERRGIPRAIRREVAERDEFRCTYVAADGRRCEGRARLEYHHVRAHALGGATTVENITLRCQAHNLVDAVADFGVHAVRGRGRS